MIYIILRNGVINVLTHGGNLTRDKLLIELNVIKMSIARDNIYFNEI